jgi:hypothetical protein
MVKKRSGCNKGRKGEKGKWREGGERRDISGRRIKIGGK